MVVKHADTAIEGFVDLELRFEDFLRAVPFESSHQRVHSPVLASLLFDCCSVIESVLKSTMDNSRYDTVQDIVQHRSRRYSSTPPYLKIDDLQAVFRADGFYAKRVWFLPRGDASFPWYSWRQVKKHPAWWQAYNRVKHARFDNAPKATLKFAMHAMKALFLALVQSLDFRQRLAERGIISCRELKMDELTAALVKWEPLQTKKTIVAVSELFGYKFISSGSPKQATDRTVFS